MRPECIQAVSAALGRQITKAESDNIEAKVLEAQAQLWKKDRAGMLGLTKAQQFEEAAKEAAKNIKAEALVKKNRVAKAIIAHDRIRTQLDNKPGMMLKNFQDVMLSVDSIHRAIRSQALASMADQGEPFMPKWLGFDQGNKRLEDVYRELHGKDTGNAEAKAYAKKLAAVFESLRIRFNAAGGKIGKLDDWSHPQAHSAYLLYKMGKTQWKEFIAPKLDRSRYVNPDGTRYSDKQFNDFLNGAWTVLSYGGQSTTKASTKNNNAGARANAHSDHRTIHFLDAENYLAYHERLGEKSLHATLLSHIDKMSKDIALIEGMGPNPQGELNYWNTYGYQDGIKQEHTPTELNKAVIDNQRLYTEVAGVFEPIASQAAARFMQTMRSLNLIALGSSGISTITDINTMMTTARFNHLPQFKMMVEHLRAFTDADSRRYARRLGIGLDTYAGNVMRYGQENLLDGVASQFPDFTVKNIPAIAGQAVEKFALGASSVTLRLSGMPFITEANRQAFSIVMMDSLEYVVRNNKTLADVDKTDYRMMTTHGIDEADFALWKQAKPDQWIDGKSTLLTPRAVMAIEGVDPVILQKSADKLMALVLDEQNMAVSTPGAKDMALMKAGTVRGTWTGELARSFWQFKSFALSYFNANWRRMMSLDSKKSTALYAAQWVAQGLALGAVATQLKEIVNGRDPLPMGNIEFAGRAMLASGGLGLFGDFFNAQNTSFGSSFLESIAGPTINKGVQIKQITIDNALKAAQGEEIHPGAESLRLANQVNPLGTVWFTKAAFNHLVLQQLQEMISPGYLRKTKQRAERQYNQQFYWNPGEPMPNRIPEFSRAFTTGDE